MDRRGLRVGCGESDARCVRCGARHLLDRLHPKFAQHTGREEGARPSCRLGAGCAGHRRSSEERTAAGPQEGAESSLGQLTDIFFRAMGES